MKLGSTLFLKSVVFLLGISVFITCIIGIPYILSTQDVRGYRPILLGLYLPAIPFFIALYQALKLLRLIENNKAFSQTSVNTLRHIKYCAVIISGLFAAGMPYIYYVANREEASGLLIIGIVIIFASTVIGTFVGLLQKLLQNAVDIKNENDLTV